MSKGATIILHSGIEEKIFLIRERKVMIDRDLAALYGVSTKVLNQAVKRNRTRFPDDFMFQFTIQEKGKLVTICDRFTMLRHSTVSPYAFTEQGVAMLSGVLNSERAIQVNIAIMRTFAKLREILFTHKDLAHKLSELEHKVGRHDEAIRSIFEAIRQLMTPPPDPAKRKIGFLPDA